jgi:transcriptional regulator with XRE-family HTH domain
MVKSPRCQQGTSGTPSRLWLHLGNRLRFRREQLGINPTRAAGHIGVTLQTYEEYEMGERLIPASWLAEIADLFAVPVFYFFENLEMGDGQPVAQHLTPAAIYTVATETDRVTALINDFDKLDFEQQQLLLLVARALASHGSTS